MNHALMKRIVELSERYRTDYLTGYDADLVARNWREGLGFFLDHACFQGRRDDISRQVCNAVHAVLDIVFPPTTANQAFDGERVRDFAAVRDNLREHIGRGKVGKQRDIEMVIGALQFVARLADRNIVAYSVGRIRNGEIESHYLELQRSQSGAGIVQVGPKVASFYLRDVVSMYGLEAYIPDEAAFRLQPIDTWVRRLAHQTGLADRTSSDSQIQRAIVENCRMRGYVPMRFNQGAWYAGYHAFDLLLEELGRPDSFTAKA